jgi:hypothetical protein
MKTISYIVLTLLLLAMQTPLVFVPASVIDLVAKDIETDRLGNLYAVAPTNQLYKYSRDGQKLSTLNYKYVGNISQVDATNPLEIYLFYRELNKIIYLDNNLAYRGETDLNRYDVIQASAIARAFDNGIWVFDLGDLQLKKFDKKGENVHTSGNIRQYLKGNVQPNYIFDNNDRVYLNCPLQGILVFDVFANYIKTIPIKGNSNVKVIDEDLYYHDGKKLFRYNLKSLRTFEFALPDSAQVQDVSIEKQRLYVVYPNRIAIYSYQN